MARASKKKQQEPYAEDADNATAQRHANEAKKRRSRQQARETSERYSSVSQVTGGMEVYGLLLSGFAVLLLLSLVSFDPRDIALDYRLRSGEVQNLIGPVGAHAADLLFSLLGLTSLIGVSTFFYFGGLLLAGRRPTHRRRTSKL